MASPAPASPPDLAPSCVPVDPTCEVDLACGICMEDVRDPLTPLTRVHMAPSPHMPRVLSLSLAACSHVFCARCLRQWMGAARAHGRPTCPLCRQEILANTIPDAKVLAMRDAVAVRCRGHTRGCTETGPYGWMRMSHQPFCAFVTSQCGQCGERWEHGAPAHRCPRPVFTPGTAEAATQFSQGTETMGVHWRKLIEAARSSGQDNVAEVFEKGYLEFMNISAQALNQARESSTSPPRAQMRSRRPKKCPGAPRRRARRPPRERGRSLSPVPRMTRGASRRQSRSRPRRGGR